MPNTNPARPGDPMTLINPMHESVLEAVRLTQPGRRCRATNRAGDPCGNHALPGCAVCRMHGARAPQVQAKSAERIALVRDAAIDRLQERLDLHGDRLDPKLLLDAVLKLGAMVELLEGRATGRTETIAPADGAEVRERLRGALDEMAARREQRQGEEQAAP